MDPKYPPVRWVAEEHLHFTVCFLGDVPATQIADVRWALRVPWGIDVFPFSGPPRVIWLGMRDGRDPLHARRGELAGRLNRYDLETPSRPFRSHLTLGRVNRTVTDLGTALRLLACPGRTEHTVARGSGEPLREPTVAGWIRVPRGRV